MNTVLPNFNSNLWKKEGTSQTYGQLVLFSTKQDAMSTDALFQNNSAGNINVKLTTNITDVPDLTLKDVDDTQRFKISLAAFSDSDTKLAILNPAQSFVSSVVENNSQNQEQPNLALIYPKIENFATVILSTFKDKKSIKDCLLQVSKRRSFNLR